jgi:hypothetical protein
VAATTNLAARDSISGSGVASANFRIPDMIDWKEHVRFTSAPLYKLIGRGKAPSKPVVKLPWGISYPLTVVGQLNGAYTSGGATLTVDDASLFQVGQTILVDSEIFRVTGVNESTNVLDVDGAYAGSSAANHSDNEAVLIMLPAIAENQATPLSPTVQGDVDYNYFQQSEWSHQFSHRAAVVPTLESLGLGVTNQLDHGLRNLMEDTIPEQMEWTLIHGKRSIGTASAASTMGGILGESSYVTTSNTSLSGALTYGTLMDNLSDLNDLAGPKKGMTWMAHPIVCEIISSFFESTRQSGPSDTKIKTYWTEIDTGWYGTIKLVPNNKFVGTAANGTEPLSRILVFNPSDLEVVPLSGDSGFSMEPVDVSGAWAERVAIRGDHTLRAQNPDSRMILGGFSITRSDYAALA